MLHSLVAAARNRGHTVLYLVLIDKQHNATFAPTCAVTNTHTHHNCRTQLRLELEWTKLEPGGATASSDGEGANGDGVNDDGADGGGGSAKRGATPVVYNYGHGGAGLTLAWGTAGDAVQLVKQALGA
jgi:hypothetical protein